MRVGVSITLMVVSRVGVSDTQVVVPRVGVSGTCVVYTLYTQYSLTHLPFILTPNI